MPTSVVSYPYEAIKVKNPSSNQYYLFCDYERDGVASTYSTIIPSKSVKTIYFVNSNSDYGTVFYVSMYFSTNKAKSSVSGSKAVKITLSKATKSSITIG
jgi:hypothetical protein